MQNCSINEHRGGFRRWHRNFDERNDAGFDTAENSIEFMYREERENKQSISQSLDKVIYLAHN